MPLIIAPEPPIPTRRASFGVALFPTFRVALAVPVFLFSECVAFKTTQAAYAVFVGLTPDSGSIGTPNGYFLSVIFESKTLA